jgi:5-enolpyruvylshikimate-3-phosphate synthase
MSLAIAGLARPGVLITHPEVVEKSYPRFWEDLAGLLGG